ncbi:MULTISPECIES: hypothetical protein [Nocardia]|uniref:Uncharacterized protein n=2 Tax=Nocardia TaxID=1817 RepID=A0A2T2YYW3_9NOCA|nr:MULTISPECIES: hypothetical protein [Nocardia]MBF6448482.1 hypothetical protein [Nocardia elegans]PSR60722.1 hypothetical protein C8259_21880 [Nocardia nova]
MFRLVELLGLCAPLLGAAIALYYRRRLGRAFGVAVLAAGVAVIGSVVGLVTSRAMWFGSGGAEGITQRMEFGAGVRNLLLVLAWALLLVAILRRPVRPEPAR